MLRLRSAFALAAITAGALLSGCGDQGGEASPSPEPPAVVALPDPADAALVNFAHATVLRKGGRDSVFDQETVGRASGAAVACGRFVNPVKSARGYYMARAGNVQLSWSDIRPKDWDMACGPIAAS